VEHLELHIYQDECEVFVDFNATKNMYPVDLMHHKGLITDYAIEMFSLLEKCRQHNKQKIYFMCYSVRCEG